MSNPDDPTANPVGPGPNERVTGDLRWLHGKRDPIYTLQQAWQDLVTHEVTWRDVPIIVVPNV